MNKFLRYSLLVLSLHLGVWAQNNLPSIARFEIGKNVPVLQLAAPDMNQIALEDELRDKQGVLYRIGVALPSMLNTTNAGTWTTLPNGARQWQVIVKTEGAEALSYLFEKFYLQLKPYFLTINQIINRVTNQANSTKKLTKMLILISFSYALFNLPYFIVYTK